jgi:hypothetical protein
VQIVVTGLSVKKPKNRLICLDGSSTCADLEASITALQRSDNGVPVIPFRMFVRNRHHYRLLGTNETLYSVGLLQDTFNVVLVEMGRQKHRLPGGSRVGSAMPALDTPLPLLLAHTAEGGSAPPTSGSCAACGAPPCTAAEIAVLRLKGTSGATSGAVSARPLCRRCQIVCTEYKRKQIAWKKGAISEDDEQQLIVKWLDCPNVKEVASRKTNHAAVLSANSGTKCCYMCFTYCMPADFAANGRSCATCRAKRSSSRISSGKIKSSHGPRQTSSSKRPRIDPEAESSVGAGQMGLVNVVTAVATEAAPLVASVPLNVPAPTGSTGRVKSTGAALGEKTTVHLKVELTLPALTLLVAPTALCALVDGAGGFDELGWLKRSNGLPLLTRSQIDAAALAKAAEHDKKLRKVAIESSESFFNNGVVAADGIPGGSRAALRNKGEMYPTTLSGQKVVKIDFAELLLTAYALDKKALPFLAASSSGDDSAETLRRVNGVYAFVAGFTVACKSASVLMETLLASKLFYVKQGRLYPEANSPNVVRRFSNAVFCYCRLFFATMIKSKMDENGQIVWSNDPLKDQSNDLLGSGGALSSLALLQANATNEGSGRAVPTSDGRVISATSAGLPIQVLLNGDAFAVRDIGVFVAKCCAEIMVLALELLTLLGELGPTSPLIVALSAFICPDPTVVVTASRVQAGNGTNQLAAAVRIGRTVYQINALLNDLIAKVEVSGNCGSKSNTAQHALRLLTRLGMLVLAAHHSSTTNHRASELSRAKAKQVTVLPKVPQGRFVGSVVIDQLTSKKWGSNDNGTVVAVEIAANLIVFQIVFVSKLMAVILDLGDLGQRADTVRNFVYTNCGIPIAEGGAAAIGSIHRNFFSVEMGVLKLRHVASALASHALKLGMKKNPHIHTVNEKTMALAARCVYIPRGRPVVCNAEVVLAME